MGGKIGAVVIFFGFAPFPISEKNCAVGTRQRIRYARANGSKLFSSDLLLLLIKAVSDLALFYAHALKIRFEI